MGDIRNFTKEEPEQIDVYKVAEFYGPSRQQLEKDKFTGKSSNLNQLIGYISKNKQFKSYRKRLLQERLIVVKEEKAKRLKRIKSGIGLIVSKIKEDPFGSDAPSLLKLKKKYQQLSQKQSLKSLNRSLISLGRSLQKYGIDPTF